MTCLSDLSWMCFPSWLKPLSSQQHGLASMCCWGTRKDPPPKEVPFQRIERHLHADRVFLINHWHQPSGSSSSCFSCDTDWVEKTKHKGSVDRRVQSGPWRPGAVWVSLCSGNYPLLSFACESSSLFWQHRLALTYAHVRHRWPKHGKRRTRKVMKFIMESG